MLDTELLVRRRTAAQQLDVSQSQLVKWERQGILKAVSVPGLRVTWYRGADIRRLAANIERYGRLSTEAPE